MSRLALVSLCALAVACGGGSSGSGGALSATVGGRPVTIAEVRAVAGATAGTPCTVPSPVGGGTIDIHVSGLKIDFTTYAGACGDYASAQCQLHQGAATVSVVFARLNPNPAGAAPAIAPGTWQVYESPTIAIPGGDGLLTVAYAQSLATDATCGGTPSPASGTNRGTLRLDRVGATSLAGFIDVTFEDGSRISGDFEATTCPGVSPDVCVLATTQAFCELPPVCNP